jgi:GNAT superfamily N-acetyltransferase
VEIRALREDDDRSKFRSGDADLDRFFVRFAGQNQFDHYLGVTYVAIADAKILGFATVAAGHTEIDRLPARARRGLARYPLPILRLARLAVDDSARGLGLGGQLLRYVLRLAVRMANDVGCVGVVVDAKKDAVGFYAKCGFAIVEGTQGRSDARPEPTLMFLATSEIVSAQSP